MALDAHYFTSIVLQQEFIDKDTGLPLTSGVVKFWRDSARNVPKDVFSLSGSPPNYTYVNEGPEITLTDTGVFEKAYYYYPYDADGNLDLYFVDWYSSTNVLQDSREAWPNIASGSSQEGVDATNYAPNGQFLLHEDLPATLTEEAGEIRADVTNIAYGGWTFERTPASSATDFILFPRYGSYVTNPAANPRYALNVQRTAAGLTDVRKDVCLTFDDVNRFASTSQKYTVGFTAQSNSGSTLNLQLILLKNYGTGGSPTTETTITTFAVTTALTTYDFAFTFGDNSAKTIGDEDDDFLQLVLRPSGVNTWDYTITDFGLVFGDVSTFVYPEVTDREAIFRALTPALPAYDNSDLGLPLILTSTGLGYDSSIVGKIFPVIYSTPEFGELACDGASYEYGQVSSDLIPYKRLGDKLFVTAANAYRFGTGPDYVNSYYAAAGNALVIGNNSFGTVTASTAATSGFTVTTIHPASTTTYGVNAYVDAGDGLYIVNQEAGSSSNSAAGTSGFTVTNITTTTLNGVSRHETQVVTADASTLTGGEYFTFQSLIATVGTDFYVWFKVDGAGADPAPGGTGIEVDLLSTDVAVQVAYKIQLALTGGQTTNVVFNAASGITAGTYWTFNSTADAFYVWYQKNGAGTDPAVAASQGILVNVLTADTAAQVAFKTQTAINRMFYATPALNGLFIRGHDDGFGVDPEAELRWSSVPGLSGDTIGSIQLDQLAQHKHGIGALSTFNGGAGNSTNASGIDGLLTSFRGGAETRGVNIALNFVIKY